MINYNREKSSLPFLNFNEDLYKKGLIIAEKNYKGEQVDPSFLQNLKNGSIQVMTYATNLDFPQEIVPIRIYEEWSKNDTSDKSNLDSSFSLISFQGADKVTYVGVFIKGTIVPDFLKQDINSEQKQAGLETVRLFNKYRTDNSKQPLTVNNSLYQKALQHSLYMAH